MNALASASLPALAQIGRVPLFPEQASTQAQQIDAIFWGLMLVTAFFSVTICAMLVWFAFKYRPGSGADRTKPIARTLALEALWIAIPALIGVGLFAWAAKVYIEASHIPSDAIDIYVVGKQWMWKVQHPNGRREINELHVPLGQNVKLIMTSQDVIHSFYIPAFRTKMDVLPGRYTYQWFQATKLGTYHLFCAEYCGTEHSQMTGRVVVMNPADYETWLAGGSTAEGTGMASSGAQVFARLQCAMCHVPDSTARAPTLDGLYSKQVKLAAGNDVVANEEYLRESIVNPTAKVVAGYPPVMPSFAGQISGQELSELVQYIKDLSPQASPGPPESQTQPAPTSTGGGR